LKSCIFDTNYLDGLGLVVSLLLQFLQRGPPVLNACAGSPHLTQLIFSLAKVVQEDSFISSHC
jgi:hypothetical protein